MFRIASLLILAALAGCKPEMVKPPQVVHVPVTQYVPIPAELTKKVPIAEPTSKTVAEAVRVARERKAGQERCNAQLDAIADISTKENNP